VTPRQGYRLRTLFARALANKIGEKDVSLPHTESMTGLQKEWDAILSNLADTAQRSIQDKLLRKAASASRKINQEVLTDFETLVFYEGKDRIKIKKLPLIVKKLDAENLLEHTQAKVEAYIQSEQNVEEEIRPVSESRAPTKQTQQKEAI
jgi:hypothetical protein